MSSSTIVAQPVDDAQTVEAAIRAQVSAQYAVYFANQALVALSRTEPRYVEHAALLDGAMLNLAVGKWVLGRAVGTLQGFTAFTGAEADFNLASTRFAEAERLAEWCGHSLRSKHVGEGPPAPKIYRPALSAHGTEIAFADDVPLVPSTCPIIVLQGSSFEMGHQYAAQAIEIYGRWIFAQLAARIFDKTQLGEISAWEAQLLRHTPEIVDMARGWAAGSTDAGLPMGYEQALAIWTGWLPPATRPLGVGEDEPVRDLWKDAPASLRALAAYSYDGSPFDTCSGCCAWGDATPDGRLVAGASTDHDCTYQATIVAFPDDGHNFIYTPFSVNGSLPAFGGVFMSGHPGLNSQGLTYVHHGGAPYVGDPSDAWGYGVRRGAGTFHVLRYADSARAARDTHLSWPVGDPGRPMGADGGFYADNDYAYVLEARTTAAGNGSPAVRERAVGSNGRAYDFLYANNNALGERAPQCHATPENGFTHDTVAGWYTRDPAEIGNGSPGEVWRKACTKSSETRNRFLFERLRAGYGKIDVDYLNRLYRTPGTLPDGSWDEIAAEYAAGGQWSGSVAHRANAFVSIIDPSARTYTGCIGPLRRSVQPVTVSHGFYYHDETNTSWQLTLGDTLAETVDAAERRARDDIEDARRRLDEATLHESVRSAFKARLALAEERLRAGESASLTTVPDHNLNDDSSRQARALRELTRAQVRARQVSDAIAPSPGL